MKNSISKYLIISCFIFISQLVNSQTFHAIMFASTNGRGIEASVANDFNKMSILFSDIASAINMNINTCYYNGDDCNKGKMLKVLNSINIQPNDIVFFYYSGHGARSLNDNSKFPQLALGESDEDCYPLYKIDDIIKSKSPKFRIVMADACNKIVPGLSSKGFPMGNSVIKGATKKLYNKLFLESSGGVVVTSSKVGETSAAFTEGGAFSLCFQIELTQCEKTGEIPTWNSFLENVKNNTYSVSQQTPYFEINVSNSNSSITSNTSITSSDDFISTLIKIANDGSSEQNRIKLAKSALSKFFGGSNAKVETIGRNGTTLLNRETSEQFLNRISTEFKLINFTVIDEKKDNSGKIISLKIHETYRQ